MFLSARGNLSVSSFGGGGSTLERPERSCVFFGGGGGQDEMEMRTGIEHSFFSGRGLVKAFFLLSFTELSLPDALSARWRRACAERGLAPSCVMKGEREKERENRERK